MTNQAQVLIRGRVFLAQQKAPFVESGVSFRGAIEYDEAEGRVRCHECGEWYLSLGCHSVRTHGVSPHDYRARHGLNRGTPLHGPIAFAAISGKSINPALLANRNLDRANAARKARQSVDGSRRTAEWRNEHSLCHAQILDRIRSVAESVGRTPSAMELRKAGLHLESIFVAFNVRSLGAVVSLAGLLPRKRGGYYHKNYSDVVLIELLRDFYVQHGRLPTDRDHRMGLLPKRSTFKRYFGSINAAYERAGLGKVASERT